MNPRPTAPWLAALALAVAFAMAGWRVFSYQRQETATGQVTLRFAHANLEPGIRAAFEEAAADYMALHPGVRVIQQTVPERVYPSWLKTQLIGGTAPDLVDIGDHAGIHDEFISRFLLPLGEDVATPNPYNRGTALAPLPWRDTFFDGLQDKPAFFPVLLEVFGIPVTLATTRLYTNVDLLRRLTGRTGPPVDFADWMRACEEIALHQQRNPTHSAVAAVTVGRESAWLLIERLFQSHTQALLASFDDTHRLTYWHEVPALAFLRGDWTLHDRCVQQGLHTIHDVAAHLQPGFLQMRREDALFQFAQGRAVFTILSSGDFQGLQAQVPFRIELSRVHEPTGRGDPASCAGEPATEANLRAPASFGITRQSPHAAQALDFLRYLTSAPAMERFARTSGWLPAVNGVPVPARIESFRPFMDGAIPGMALRLMGREAERVVVTELHRLVAPQGSTDAFVAAIEHPYRTGIQRNLERFLDTTHANIRRQDTVLAAAAVLAAEQPEDLARARRLDQIIDVLTDMSANALTLEEGLAAAGSGEGSP